MIYNPFYYPIFGFPYLPRGLEKPPTLYSIMNSMANFDAEEQTKIKDLAKATHEKIFNFDYPLSSNINKEDFECIILNKFIMRRISYETFTAWQIQLNVKLNEIMPMYNKLFDAIQNWNLFEDGEKITRLQEDKRTIENTLNSTTTNELQNTSNTTNTSDRRYSDTPENQIQNIKDGNYVTDYNFDTNTAEDTSTSNAKSNSNSTNNTKDNNNLVEETTRTIADKMNLYKQFLESKQNIYSMIFKDLECLFYQLV